MPALRYKAEGQRCQRGGSQPEGSGLVQRILHRCRLDPLVDYGGNWCNLCAHICANLT